MVYWAALVYGDITFRDLVKDYPDGRGHMDQEGIIIYAPILASEIYDRWKITLKMGGPTQLKSDLTKLSPNKHPI